MEYLGFALAIVIGVLMGLLGAGGSILTVPLLVYVFDLEAVKASTYSLFIVGVTSTIGAIGYFRQGQIDWKTILRFGIPSVLGVWVTRRWLAPAIPDILCQVGNFTLTKNTFLLLLFAVLMLAAAWQMRKKNNPPLSISSNKQANTAALLGFFIGALTSLVGAGGGFMIIPTLVLLLGLDMKKAVGTSLLLIAINALLGFFVSPNFQASDWQFLGIFAALAIIGVLLGLFLSTKINGSTLKPLFAWIIFAVAIYIIGKEIF